MSPLCKRRSKANVFEMIKKFINESERSRLLDFVGKISSQHSKPLKILDVGCGYGTNLVPLQELGIK